MAAGATVVRVPYIIEDALKSNQKELFPKENRYTHAATASEYLSEAMLVTLSTVPFCVP